MKKRLTAFFLKIKKKWYEFFDGYYIDENSSTSAPEIFKQDPPIRVELIGIHLFSKRVTCRHCNKEYSDGDKSCGCDKDPNARCPFCGTSRKLPINELSKM